MSGPMDCADRISVMTAERALEPVRQLGELADLTAVTVRTFCGGRRLDVTVRKVWPAGSDADPAYAWALVEVEEDGTPLEGGLTAEGSAAAESPSADPEGVDPESADPESAYWSAVDEAEELTRASG